ncbi:nucleoside/nucleotide kinase family protein [Actinocatenispora comari]|uniref:ATPase n=1 Tax=Actinocatenispora comari TaxID=2807577 RepID=A0A8J4ELL3_9ACTN|nr:hypothetical protein [Actinocatenispora comari]GIL28641.1 hypothetical protein NUM_38950 [Actinocatenispora comari]
MTAANGTGTEALLIGGRSGVGKSSVGWEIAALLKAADVAHTYVEGDTLDQTWPKPAGDPTLATLTEENLHALWRNFAARGQHRLIYTNTAAVLDAALVRRATGAVRCIGVLLTASDDTTHGRLAAREIGSELDLHTHRSAQMAVRLDRDAPSWVHRIGTDGRTVTEIAAEIIGLTAWAAGTSLR